MTSLLMLQLNSEIVIIALVVLIGCSATYFLTQWNLKRKLEAMRLQIDQALAPKPLPQLEETPGRATSTIAAPARSAGEASKPKPSPSAAPSQAQPSREELAHETLVVIAAAVSAFLGKTVRLRSARLIHPSEGNAWAQQGRVFVQASHNLGLAPRLH